MPSPEQNTSYESTFSKALSGANKILDDLGLNSELNRSRKNNLEALVIFTNPSVDPRVVECFRLASLARHAPCNVIDIGKPDPQGKLSDQEKAGVFDFEELKVKDLADVVIKLTPDESDEGSDMLYHSIYGHNINGVSSRVRAAESPGLTFDSLCSAGIFADIDIIRERQKEAAGHLREAKFIHIRGINGTDLTLEFNPQEKVYSDPPEVDLRKRIPEGQEGRGANFPTGEVWRNPLPLSVNGVIVLDNVDTSIPIFKKFFRLPGNDSIIYPNLQSRVDNTGLADEPIKITVSNGRIIRIDGGYTAKSLAWYIDQEYVKAKARGHPDPEGVYYFGTEIGIGANPLVSSYQPGSNISVVESEKQLALHIALGHSQTEYPYERPDSREYNKGPIHLDFIVDPKYKVEITPYSGDTYTLFGPAGSLDRFRMSPRLDVTDIINPYENGRRKPRWGIYKNIQINVPNELINLVEEDTREVIELANKMLVIEYDSGKPGDVFFLTSGMHGEEAKGKLTIDNINDQLDNNLISFSAGKIIIIPRLNLPGCKSFTRYVFEDEKDTNLNNEFHHYVTGEWDEFFALKRKTSKLAWIIMSYMRTKVDKYMQEFGTNHDVYHIDLHREEGMPFIRIDRMDENKELLEKLINAYWGYGLPIALETEGWRDKAELHQTISAVGASFGWNSITIEEGNTVRPDLKHGSYIAYQLLLFLQEKGLIKISPELEKRIRYIKKELVGGRENPLRRARKFWEQQQETGKMYRLEVVEPTPRYYLPNRFPYGTYLENALTIPDWNGIITCNFDGRMRGIKIESNQSLAYGEFAFGEFNSREDHPILPISHGQFILSSEDSELWVADMTEPRNPKENTLCRYGYFYDDDTKKSITLWQVDSVSLGRKFHREDIISPDELMQKKKEGIPINEKILDETFSAIPDSKWEGRFDEKGKIVLFPKSGEVRLN